MHVDGERSKILEQRRLRNIESAKRSRERLRREPQWMEVQMKENEERIRMLENTIGGLTKELQKKPKKKNEAVRHSIHFGKQAQHHPHFHGEKRPEWFGEPF